MVLGLSAMRSFAEESRLWGDKDADGKLNKKEFCEARALSAEKTGKKIDPAAIEKKFEERDVNGDGFISREELAAK
jgi:Ca2+-binding EF-hand superfamily protein